MRINLNGSILTITTRIFDIITVTVLYLLCSLPVVTIGAASVAMYRAMIALAGDDCTSVAQCFFEAFKANFKQATLLFLPILVIGAVVGADIVVCFGFETEQTMILAVMRGLTIFCTGLYAAMVTYIFAGIAMYQVTWKQAVTNALQWTMKKLPGTLLILLLAGAMVFSIAVLWYFAFPVIAAALYYQAKVLRKVFGLEVPAPLHHDEEIDYS